ncbi:MAG: hypothetical protein ACREOZ_03995, partial [Gloeomargaritales cyanobacterium]
MLLPPVSNIEDTRKTFRLKAAEQIQHQQGVNKGQQLTTNSHLQTIMTAQKQQGKWIGLMRPSGRALAHPAAPALIQYAQHGCPVDCGSNWTHEQITKAVERGPHPSANDPEAAKELWAEAREKVNQRFAQIVAWNDIKDNPPPSLKVSPVAMIPHKSRKFRAILDLSFQHSVGQMQSPSVNDATKKMAHQETMDQMGSVLPRLFNAKANANQEDGSLLFTKLDIKDGFWLMVVPEDQKWNFAYVLPKRIDDD